MKTAPNFICLLILFNSVLAHAQVPVYNSLPSATATIYLDFDGQSVRGTAWNWGGLINALPVTLKTEAITEIFNRVAEDYRIFNINVTTDSTVYKSAPINRRTRVIITPSSAWYGNAGGVAYVGSFNWGEETPAWVFSNRLNNNIKYIAEACSHEAGHTLGLQHQSLWNTSCGKVAEYFSGQGSGEIGWAPIMGVGYYRNLTTWYNGPNSTGCNNYQNDIDIIGGADNGFGFRPDDHADLVNDATNVTLSGTSFGMTGIVNHFSDADVFRMDLPFAQNFKLTAVPQNVGAGNSGANIDIKVSLLTATGDTIGRYNPSLLLNAGVDTNLYEGTYYLVAEGTGNANLTDYGSVGFYSMTGELNRVLPLQRFRLTGSVTNGLHSLAWNYMADEEIGVFEVHYSEDGARFEKLLTVQPTERSVTYRPLTSKKLFYRIKAKTPDERTYYSNIISLHPGVDGKPVQVINSLVRNKLTINSAGQFRYQIIQQNGQLLQSGLLKTGLNSLDVQPTASGLMILRVYDGNQYWTEKLVTE